jgi:MFS family permease
MADVARLSSARTSRLSPRVALYLQASIIVSFLAASSAPTSLYAVYQARWGLTPITITIVFGIYALAVLAALLTVGSLSDYVGRRPVLLFAIVIQAAGLVLLSEANGLPELVIGRILQGVATGAAVGAVGAGMLDLDRARGTLANAITPSTGTATGGLLSGLFVEYLPAPTRLVYVVMLAIVVLQGVGVAFMAETVARRSGALASLRPHFDLPPPTRRPLLVVGPVLFAAWALAGFVGSLGPSLARSITGSDSLVMGGLAVFIVAGAGAFSVLALYSAPPATVARVGTLGLMVGVSITLVATATTSLIGLCVGLVVAGVGFVSGFQGAIRTVLPLAPAEHRAGILSVVYLISYVGLSLPAIVAGVVVVRTGSLELTALCYGIAVIVLAALALAGLARRSHVETAPVNAAGVRAESHALGCPCMG